MRIMLLALTLIITVSNLGRAGVIYDARTGIYDPGPIPDATGVMITGIIDNWFPSVNGFYCTEIPAGEYSAIFLNWSHVFPSEMPSIGDIVDITDLFYLEEEILHATSSSEITVVGSGAVPVIDMTVAGLNSNPGPWAYTRVDFAEGFSVTEIIGDTNLAWRVASTASGEIFAFWKKNEFGQVEVGDCYQGAQGFVFPPGFQTQPILPEWNLQIIDGGVQLIDCSLPVQSMNFGSVKSLYK